MAPADVTLFPFCIRRGERGVMPLKFTGGCNMAFEDKIDYILNNISMSEDQVKAEFYHQMRLLGIPVHLEVRVPTKTHRSGYFKPDALIGNPVVCAVEFKRSGKSGPREGTRQFLAYESLGLPWEPCCGMDDIGATVIWAMELLEMNCKIRGKMNGSKSDKKWLG